MRLCERNGNQKVITAASLPVAAKVMTPKGRLRGGGEADVDSKRLTPNVGGYVRRKAAGFFVVTSTVLVRLGFSIPFFPARK